MTWRYWALALVIWELELRFWGDEGRYAVFAPDVFTMTGYAALLAAVE